MESHPQNPVFRNNPEDFLLPMMMGNFCDSYRPQIFFRINFFSKILSGTLYQSANGLDPD